jgi:hypothetical protein
VEWNVPLATMGLCPGTWLRNNPSSEGLAAEKGPKILCTRKRNEIDWKTYSFLRQKTEACGKPPEPFWARIWRDRNGDEMLEGGDGGRRDNCD